MMLLERGADTIMDENKNTPLHFAAEKGWTSVAKRLMQHRNMAGAINREGQIPLELAILNEHNECATFLVKSMEPARYVT